MTNFPRLDFSSEELAKCVVLVDGFEHLLLVDGVEVGVGAEDEAAEESWDLHLAEGLGHSRYH